MSELQRMTDWQVTKTILAGFVIVAVLVVVLISGWMEQSNRQPRVCQRDATPIILDGEVWCAPFWAEVTT